METLLVENLSIIANTPSGVKKIRKLILQLAIMGKLVPQDPNDEPANKLLKRVLQQKAKLLSASKVKSNTIYHVVTDAEALFPLPTSWARCRFGEITINRDGDRIPLSAEIRESRKGPYDYYGASGVIDYIDDYIFDSPKLLIGEDGANLVNRSTPIAFIASGKFWVNNHAHVLDTTEPVIMNYLMLYINAISLLPYITGTAQPKMNQAKMNQIPVSLPPLAEQQRIVAKVNELMALCDLLEEQQSSAESAHQQLIKELLNTLAQSKDQSEFATNWERIKQNFDVLFTTEESIDALKQALLQLAVMGKLVPQDSNDESAYKLIKQSQLMKTKLYSSGKMKKEQPQKELNEGERQILPEGWCWARLSEIASVIDPNPSHRMPRYVDKGIPFISTENFGVNDSIDFSIGKCVHDETLKEQINRFEIRHGAFALSRIGTIGKTITLPPIRNYCLSHALCVISPYLETFDTKYLRLAVSAESVFSVAHAGVQSVGVPDLGLGVLRAMPIPVPPAREQSRIVAKVNELMEMCDRLKSELIEARITLESFTEVLTKYATTSSERNFSDDLSKPILVFS